MEQFQEVLHMSKLVKERGGKEKREEKKYLKK